MSLIQQNMGAIYDGSQRLIAPVLNSTTATQNWAVGQEFILDGNLYEVTTAISSGSQIIVSGSSANCALADTVTEQLNAKERAFVETDGVKTHGQILDALGALVDDDEFMANLDKAYLVRTTYSNGSLIFYRLCGAANNAYAFSFVQVMESENFQALYITLRPSSSTYYGMGTSATTDGKLAFTNRTPTVAAAGTRYSVYY